ncbi:MAG TPA: ricin-type beta-trefoil lectin domain protein [Bryobacteraceae bacterium]|nr:ricin-type beta-trefoil lectin domain protein [Bryobacteraceae bacterium]
MISLNVDEQGRSIPSFSLSIAISIAAVFAFAVQVQAPAQVQTEDAIVNLVSAESGKCLQPINQSRNQGDAIVQQTCNGSVAQQWTVHAVSTGRLHLINKDSGLCLDARGKAADGTPIEQWPCNEITNENWGFGSTNNRLVSEVSNTSSHCIATSGNQDGLPMTLRQCSADPSEIWKTEHASSVTCAGRSGNSPLDLTWTECDPNGFPLNPAFVYQVTNGGRVPPGPTGVCPSATSSHQFPSACVSFPVTYDSCFLCGPHVNYFAVTYQGPVDWWERSAWYADDDYNFFMNTPNNAGEFVYPPTAGVAGVPQPEPIEIEFDSRETINYFRSRLWTNFHNLVDSNNSAAQAYIKGKTAVVTSLFGFDCGHASCSSEEHPAYAMALDMDDSNFDDDQWGVFARNWGDEGFCSVEVHTLPITDLKVLIPWVPGATAVAVLPSTHFNQFDSTENAASNIPVAAALLAAENRTKLPQPQITVANGEGILIDFTLANAAVSIEGVSAVLEVGWEGEVHLQWTLPPPVRTTLTARIAARRAAAPARPAEDEQEKPENRIASLFTKLPQPQQAALTTRFAPPAAQPPAVQPSAPMRPVLTVAKLPAPSRLARPMVPQSVSNPQMTQRNEALRQALCTAYKNNVPDFPSICTAR